jgi:predicted P-loop ATPase
MHDVKTITLEWERRLLRGPRSNEPHAVLANAITPLRFAPEWEGVLGYDENKLRAVLLKPPPWKTKSTVNGEHRSIEDLDEMLTSEWLQNHGILVGKEIVRQAIQVVARDNSYHPIKNYLNSLEWDGTPRIDTWLGVYFGTTNSKYNSMVGRKFLLSAVARIMQPGCKNDYCLMLEGPQGVKKSMSLEILAVDPSWHTDDLPRLTTKDAKLHLHGFWIVEIGELAAMRGLDSSEIKAFISRQRDDYRPPFGVHTIEVPRTCVFVGTVNRSEYLNDETGGRRFLPVETEVVNVEDLLEDRDQLWAEAMLAYKSGETWWPDANNAEVSAEQQRRYMAEPWAEIIENYLRTLEGSTSTTEILERAIKKPASEWKMADQVQVGKILCNLGWRKIRPQASGEGSKRERRYIPGPNW